MNLDLSNVPAASRAGLLAAAEREDVDSKVVQSVPDPKVVELVVIAQIAGSVASVVSAVVATLAYLRGQGKRYVIEVPGDSGVISANRLPRLSKSCARRSGLEM